MRSFIIVAVILLCIEGALGYEVATASAETAPGTNVVLTMAIGDDGPAFSAQSYSDTAKKFIDCHHCGAIVEHPSEPKGPARSTTPFDGAAVTTRSCPLSTSTRSGTSRDSSTRARCSSATNGPAARCR